MAGKELTKNMGLVGSGIGVVMFLVYGLMQSLALGGTAGLIVANAVYGPGAIELSAGGLVARAMVGGSMLAGVLVGLVIFLFGGTVAGAAVGSVMGLVVRGSEAGVAAGGK